MELKTYSVAKNNKIVNKLKTSIQGRWKYKHFQNTMKTMMVEPLVLTHFHVGGPPSARTTRSFLLCYFRSKENEKEGSKQIDNCQPYTHQHIMRQNPIQLKLVQGMTPARDARQRVMLM